jgi:two-component system, cell cycle sensor histidine kinase and response regulator CckA
MNTASPFPWPGPTAAENVRTGFRSIFEHAPLPAARCNPQGEVIEMNSAFAQALQAGLADQRALRLSDLAAPDDREATESLLHNLLDCTCDTIRLAGRNTAKNGQAGRAVTSWMAWRLPGSGEESNHASVIAEPDRDCSPYEEGLLQAQRWEAVGWLAGGIVHDSNNFLSGAMLYCDLLLTSLDSCDRRRRHVGEIRSATMQATALVQQLLVFARPRASQVHALCLHQIVQALQDLLTRPIGENIVLELSLDPNLGPVTIDQAQAQQIFLNLVRNARDALPNGGGIVVKTTNCQFQNIPGSEPVGRGAPTFPCVLLTVGDNGCGMDTKTRRPLFEPFCTPKGAANGTGLGSTVRRIVTTNGGLIHVESEARGTRVMILLPGHCTPSPPNFRTSSFHIQVHPDTSRTTFQEFKKESHL